MSVIGKIPFRKINKISPSQFYSMKNCPYKSLLAEAFDKKPLLPISPNAYFGTVLHKMLELISGGELRNEMEFNLRFESEMLVMENNLKEKGYKFLVPLQMNVKDFGIKKIQLKKHLRNITASTKQLKGIRYTSEKWFESKDKLIVGKIDLIIEEGNEIEIIDFKTGAITENIFDDNGGYSQEVKNEYQDQLKIYAFLFYECTGKFPTKLSLADLAKQKYKVEFSESECKAIFDAAKQLLAETNKSIDIKEFKANPSESNCKFCLYRPACATYLQYITKNDSFNDIRGFIKDVIQYQNGNVSVFIKTGQDKISITGFSSDKFQYFNTNRNNQLTFFNLKKEATRFAYSATNTTKIYGE